MEARCIRYACSLALLLGALPSLATANGRMPGANDMLLDPRAPEHFVLRATFGVVQSFDGGESWQWICEQVIGTSGVIADPPTAVVADGTVVLLPPTGGALLSRDRGCSWPAAPEPLAGQRGVDLTLDPSDAAHLLVLMSTLDKLDDAGFGIYRNLLIETRDSGNTWRLLSDLPSDFEAETVEVAASDRSRMYVSGTASKNPRLGIVQRSEDGGASWTQSSLELPAGTGSLLISAIHPQLPDRLWLRVPARGDTIGVLPGRLYLSEDKGQSFRMLASTQHGMFGFALSADGAQLAYGGPSDGLYVGPADGSGEFSKVNSLGIRCLRWTASGDLYACGTEPANAFSLGVSRDRGASFEKLYALAETCPEVCAEESSSPSICQDAWQITRPALRASGSMCEAPWSGAALDAGKVEQTEAGPNDATTQTTQTAERDATLAARPSTAGARSDCSCRLGPEPRARTGLGLISVLALVTLLCARSRRRSRRFV
jgi:hypothetical protein